VRRPITPEARRGLIVTSIAAIAALLAGCGKSDDTGAKITALEARLDRIEKRLAVGEDRVASVAALEETMKDLERRLAAAEARSAAERPAEPTTPPSASAEQSVPSPAKPMTGGEAGVIGPVGSARRAAVAELGAELQAKIARIREQHGDAPPAERLRAVREAHQWYRERLRAILRGEWTGAGGADAEGK